MDSDVTQNVILMSTRLCTDFQNRGNNKEHFWVEWDCFTCQISHPSVI